MTLNPGLLSNKQLAKSLAPNYEYLDSFKNKKDHLVFLLKKNKTKFVLKSQINSMSKYLNNELISLDTLSDYERIPRIEEEFRDVNGYSGIIKTYVPGITLWDIIWSKKASLSQLKSFKDQAKDRLKDMHSYEVYNLDTIKESNILVSLDYSFCGYFDFDVCTFTRDKTIVKKDFDDLETAFNRSISRIQYNFGFNG